MVPFRPPHAARTLGQSGVTGPLFGGLYLDGQGMNMAAQLLFQGLVDQTVALYQGQALKLGADHQDPEVGLRAGRDGMHVALIVDLQVLRLKALAQLGSDGVLYRSTGVGLHPRSGVEQLGAEGPDTQGAPGQHQRLKCPTGLRTDRSEKHKDIQYSTSIQ